MAHIFQIFTGFSFLQKHPAVFYKFLPKNRGQSLCSFTEQEAAKDFRTTRCGWKVNMAFGRDIDGGCDLGEN